MTIDTHVHVWEMNVLHPYQRGEAPLRAEPSDLEAVLRTAEVAAAIIVPSSADPVNEHALAAARRLGPAYGAVALVDPELSDEEIDRLVEGGYVGVRFNLQAPGAAQAVRLGARRLLTRASLAGLAISCQMRPAHGPLIREIATDWPELTIIVDHLGSPPRGASEDDLAGVLTALEARNVSVKFSALDNFSNEPFPYRDTWPWARAVAERAGDARIIWGSNWPLSAERADYRDLLRLAAAVLPLSGPGLEAVTGQNALRAYNLEHRRVTHTADEGLITDL